MCDVNVKQSVLWLVIDPFVKCCTLLQRDHEVFPHKFLEVYFVARTSVINM